MKLIFILICTLSLIVTTNVYSKEIKSLSQFENNLVKCLSSFSSKNLCVATIIKDHLPAGNDSVKPVADQVEKIFVQWLAKERVENVYPVQRKELGEFMILQNYIIEDSTASTLLFEITYRKVLGSWHVLKFNINSKSEYISRKLGY